MATSATLSATPKWQVCDDNGLPLAGALLYAYVVGSSTPKDTYTDYQATHVAPWPVPFDAGGRAEVWLGTGLYKLILEDAQYNIIWTVDGVSGSAGSGVALISNTVVGATGSLVSLDPAVAPLVTTLGYHTIGDGGGGTFRWDDNLTQNDGGIYIKPASLGYSDPGRWVRLLNEDESINVRWYGALGTGSDDELTSFSNAIAYCTTKNSTLLIPEGTFYLSAAPYPAFTSSLPVKFCPKGAISWDNNLVITMMALIDDNDDTQHFNVTSPIYAPKFVAGTISRPQYFGQVGTGNDDLAELQSAINSVSNGGSVYLSAGTYVSSESLIMVSNVKVYGQGINTVVHPGSGTVPWVAAGQALFTHDVASNVLNNVEFSNFTIDASSLTGRLGLQLNLSNSYIHDMSFHAIYDTGIVLGGGFGSSSNVQVYDNLFNNVGYGSGYETITVQSGTDIKFTNNELNCTLGGGALGLTPAGYSQGVSEIQIHDNSFDLCDIIVHGTTTAGAAVTDVTIKDNEIYGSVLIGTSQAYGPSGDIIITNNDFTLPQDITGLDIECTTHQASAYTIVNNQFHFATPTGSTTSPVKVSGIASTVPTIINGNTFDTPTSIINSAINEVSSHGLQYGLNPTANFINPFNGAADSTTIFPSDTTYQRNLFVQKNLYVTGTIVNPPFTSLFQSMISGLDMSTTVLTGNIGINQGTASTQTLDGTYSLTNLNTTFVKSVATAWVQGTGHGGLASDTSYPPVANKWWHVFLLGNKTDPSKADIGFSEQVTPTTLMSDVASSGFNTYRRIGSVMYDIYTGGMAEFHQMGDEFWYSTFRNPTSVSLPGGGASDLALVDGH